MYRVTIHVCEWMATQDFEPFSFQLDPGSGFMAGIHARFNFHVWHNITTVVQLVCLPILAGGAKHVPKATEPFDNQILRFRL